MKKMIALLLSLFAVQTALAELPVVTEKLDLEAAKNFAVDRLEGGYSLITVQNGGRFLLIPAGMDAPDGLDADIMLLYMPLDNLFVASTSTVALMDEIGALSAVTQTTYDVEDWYLPSVKQAVQDGQIAYIGHYKQPDFERIALNQPKLAVFSTMIEGTPDVREKLDELGIPLLVDSSALEETPLGRMEWIKLYGLLLGKTEAAESFFQAQSRKLDDICTGESTGKTVAFFYISSNGSVNVRKPGDYISKMIELAGGQYIFSADDLNVEENALSTMNIQMEAFYAGAKDADYLIYNSSIDGAVSTIDQLLQKSPLLADFAAVQSGNVWCTEQNMFQQTTGAADMIADLHAVVTGEADGKTQLTYLHRVQ